MISEIYIAEYKKNLLPFVLSLFRDNKKFLSPLAEEEDLLAEGLLGLAQSISKYKKVNNASIVTFAFRRVYGQIINAVNRENRFHERHTGVQTLYAVAPVDIEYALDRKHLLEQVICRIETHMEPLLGAVLVWSYLEETQDKEILRRLRMVDDKYVRSDIETLRQTGLAQLRDHFMITNGRR